LKEESRIEEGADYYFFLISFDLIFGESRTLA
jgi:hypothetical protein